MSLETYNTAQGAYAEPKHQEYSESFDPGEDNGDAGDAHAVLLEASGAYSPPDKSVVADAGKISFEPSADAASLDSSVSVSVADGAEDKERESGAWTALGTIGLGVLDEVVNHPLRLLGNAVVGVAIGAATVAAVAALGTVGTAVAAVAATVAVGVGAYKLATSLDDWAADGEVIANADQHTAEEVAAARANLIDVGHGTADFIAGTAGGIFGGMRSALIKDTVVSGGRAVGEVVRTRAGQVGEYLTPVAKKIAGTTDTAIVKAGVAAGAVGDAVTSVATPVLARGAQVLGTVGDKVAAVASPIKEQAASVILTVGQKAAPYVERATGVVSQGADKASQLGGKGVEKVTGIATIGADKVSSAYMTVVDGARTQGTRAAEFAASYVDKVKDISGELRVRAMRGTSDVLSKASRHANRLAERMFTDRYLAAAERSLRDPKQATPVGYTGGPGAFDPQDLVVKLPDNRVIAIVAPKVEGEPHVARFLPGRWHDRYNWHHAQFKVSAKPREASAIPDNLRWSDLARQTAQRVYYGLDV